MMMMLLFSLESEIRIGMCTGITNDKSRKRGPKEFAGCITNGKKQKARPKGLNLKSKGSLESEIHIAILVLEQRRCVIMFITISVRD